MIPISRALAAPMPTRTAFAQIKIDPEALPFVMPPADGVILTSRFRQSVLGDEALTLDPDYLA